MTNAHDRGERLRPNAPETHLILRYGLRFLLAFLFCEAAVGAAVARAQLVSSELMNQADARGTVRVIVRLATPRETDAAPDSDILQSLRRSTIGEQRDNLRASLSGVPHRIRRTFEDFPFVVVELGMDGIRTLDSLGGTVAEVFEDRLLAPMLVETSPLVQADQVQSGAFDGFNLDGSGTVVAVVDTGVDGGHPFLSGKIVEEACFSTNDPLNGSTSVCPGGVETSFAAGSGAPCAMADCDHGTHVAGIAAGNGQDGAVAPFSGIAAGADLMAIQVFSRIADARVCSAFGMDTPCPLAFTSDVMAAFQRILDVRNEHNLASVNLSLGGGRFTSACNKDPLKPLVDGLRTANIATIIASGNSGFSNALSSPACISTAVSVGSTNDGDDGTAVDRVSSFSNSASFLTLLAPGYLITSSVRGGYADYAGTSMAAPHVAGAFALLKQALPSASVTQMVSALKAGGLPVRDSRNRITKSRIRILDALAELPIVQFKSATYSAVEKTESAVITVTRSGVTSDVSTVQYSTTPGSAAAGVDYTAQSGTLVFAAGETSKSFKVRITGDAIDEADETVNLVLENPAGTFLGARNTAVLTITDNDSGGVLRFSKASYSVDESGPVATITVTRSGGVAGGVTVDYAMADGTAVNGLDYSAVSGTLTFAAGQTSRTFTIPILADTIDEASKTVTLTLSNPTGGATLGSITTAVLTIVDNDSGGAFRFGASSYKVMENGGAATITVTRSGGVASDVTVDYATADGSAGSGSDYTAVSGTLVFNAGEKSKTFTIPILDDTSGEGNETVSLTLTNPAGGATLGAPATVPLTIADDEVALQFSSATYRVSETKLKALITVTRSGPTASVVGVSYGTSAGSALAGSDYKEKSGVLTFARGEVSKTIPIVLVDDRLVEPEETVNLTLSDPTGGAFLAPRNAAVLTITSNDR